MSKVSSVVLPFSSEFAASRAMSDLNPARCSGLSWRVIHKVMAPKASTMALSVSGLTGIVSFFGMVGSVVLMGVRACNVADCVLSPRRPFKTARLADYYSRSPFCVARGQASGFRCSGVVGDFLAVHKGSISQPLCGGYDNYHWAFQ